VVHGLQATLVDLYANCSKFLSDLTFKTVTESGTSWGKAGLEQHRNGQWR